MMSVLKSISARIKSLGFWDWFFVPLWLLTLPVFLYGSRTLLHQNLWLLLLFLLYVLGTIPYFWAKGRRSKSGLTASTTDNTTSTDVATPMVDDSGRERHRRRHLRVGGRRGALEISGELFILIALAVAALVGAILAGFGVIGE